MLPKTNSYMFFFADHCQWRGIGYVHMYMRNNWISHIFKPWHVALYLFFFQWSVFYTHVFPTILYRLDIFRDLYLFPSATGDTLNRKTHGKSKQHIFTANTFIYIVMRQDFMVKRFDMPLWVLWSYQINSIEKYEI